MLTDFQGADLSGASLEVASFIGTNFTGADFFTAGTPIANLDKADLSNAILTGVDAQNISFIDGIAIGAIGATVTNADFSNSQLIKSDCTNALDLNTAIFAGADTTDAIGI
ncbi:MAG: pentapeptide repeat-containing protein [Okeania sp. SIO2F4]|uniref:pentapeptide repeat-containing protein n=1 Tax=Okeania sp. SIO2F4 TaxID=2607790 RepID=UPI00142A48DC|nr:pentapeptide repeat-containing protein [Okeania sp. SIO2F4]NES01434.1 pentapeptide repeat-containing protein [Okeania sp. SIO2F4]